MYTGMHTFLPTIHGETLDTILSDLLSVITMCNNVCMFLKVLQLYSSKKKNAIILNTGLA